MGISMKAGLEEEGQGRGSAGSQSRAAAEFVSVVADIREQSRALGRQRWQIALDQTGFAPRDSGVLEAVARSGVKLVVPVLDVVVDSHGELWHVVEKPLGAGTQVTGRVDGRQE